MKELRLALLGKPEISQGDVSITGLFSAKALALLCYLAMTGQPHLRSRLAALLWGDIDEALARNNLSKALTLLRPLVGPYLHITRQEVAFDRESSYWLDVDAFERGACVGADIGRLRDAVELYRGDFLEGFHVLRAPAFEEWIRDQQEPLHELVLGALHTLLAHYAELGETGRAANIDYARRLLALEPWQEEAHRQLMALYAQSGQREAALRQYETCVRALEEEGLPPAPETTALYKRIRAERVREVHTGVEREPTSTSSATLQNNLPAQTTPFVGRAEERAKVVARLHDPGCRLLTVVGPGGMGKTRLALQAAEDLVAEGPDGPFAQGIWFVALDPVRTPEDIASAVVQALGLSREDAAPRQQLLDYLRPRKVLLLLDNIEHLLAEDLAEGTVGRVGDILMQAPRVKILATSRAHLNVRGENLLHLGGMDAPRAMPPASAVRPEEALQYSAVQLFVQGARRVRSDFELGAEDIEPVGHICRLVQGMPLGLLLAAAWVKVLPLTEIAAEIERSLDFLAADWRDAPERQRSMRAVFDHSYALIAEGQRKVLGGLSVLRGPFTRRAAQAVTGASLRELAALVDMSLLERTLTDYYELHALLRQYAQEKLDRSPGGGQDVCERHATYYLGLLKRWATELKGPRQRAALNEMAAEQDNLRAAWEWMVEQRRWEEVKDSAEALARFYDGRGHAAEARLLFCYAAERLSTLVDERTAVSSPTTSLILIELLAWQGRFEPDDPVWRGLGERCLKGLGTLEQAGYDVCRQKALVLRVFARILAGGKTDRAREWLETSLCLYRHLNDAWGEAVVLQGLGGLAWDEAKLENAARQYEESLALFRAQGEERGIASCLHGLHEVYGWQGQFEKAQRVVDERMELAREWGDLASLTLAHEMEASLRYIAGCFTKAADVFEKCIQLVQELGDRVQLAYLGACLGHAKLDSGDYEAGREIAERSRKLGNELHYRRAISAALPVLARYALLKTRYKDSCTRYEETLELAEELGYRRPTIFYEGEWAVAELLRGQRDEARRHVYLALHAAADEQRGKMPIRALPPAALWLAAEGQAERAVEVYALALRYPHIANSRWYQDVFSPSIAGAAASLPPEVVRAAQARGRTRDLAATVRELLAGLEE